MSEFKDAQVHYDRITQLGISLVNAKLQLGDKVALFILAFASFIYLSRAIVWDRKPKGYHLLFVSPQVQDGLVSDSRKGPAEPKTRNINEKLNKTV